VGHDSYTGIEFVEDFNWQIRNREWATSFRLGRNQDFLRPCIPSTNEYILIVMIDLVKKTMLAGIGLAVVTKDKVLESLDELVQKGKLTKEEAAAMSEKIVEEGKTETEKAKVEASKLFIDMLNRANVVTKDQYDALAARVTELEGKLHKEFPNGD